MKIARPALSNMVLMRALGAHHRTLALRFGLSVGEVRDFFVAWGEPARLKARHWRMDYSGRPAEIEVAQPAPRSIERR